MNSNVELLSSPRLPPSKISPQEWYVTAIPLAEFSGTCDLLDNRDF